MRRQIPSTSRRVNASTLVQRLKATPVTLYPEELNSYLVESKRAPHQRRSSAALSCPSPTAGVEHGDDAAGGHAAKERRPIPLPSPSTAAAGTLASHAAGGGGSGARGGLCANDILVVGKDRESQEAVTQWTHTIAAAHALNGGRVVYAFTPGSGTMQQRQFAECVERLVVREQQGFPTEGPSEAVYKATPHRGGNACAASPVGAGHLKPGYPNPADLIGGGGCDGGFCEAERSESGCASGDNEEEDRESRALQLIQLQQQRVLDAMGRVDAVHCHSVEELYVFCSMYQIACEDVAEDGDDVFLSGIKSRRRAPSREEGRAARAAGTAVPLIIVEGCGGENSYLYRYERAAGLEVPLRHWLLCLLQRRTQCALVLVEDVSAAQQQRQYPPTTSAATGGGPNAVAQTLSRESDMITRLLASHHHYHGHRTPQPQHSVVVPASVSSLPFTAAGPSDPVRRRKKRPPALLLHGDDIGDDFWSFPGQARPLPPPPPFAAVQEAASWGAAPGCDALTATSAAEADLQLPVADIGGYTITYLSFGSAPTLGSPVMYETVLSATALSTR